MYACDNGVTAAAAQHFSRELDKPLKESMVRGLKKVYLVEVGHKRGAREEDLSVDKLNPAKRGRPLLVERRID